MQTDKSPALEEQIGRWRSLLSRRQATHTVDEVELEDRLREQISALTRAGLGSDEAFLVAVKRMGDLDGLSRELAREHSGSLWKQLVFSHGDSVESKAAPMRDMIVAFGLAAAAGLLVKVPSIFGVTFDTHELFYLRNTSFFVLPLLGAFFVWKRRLRGPPVRWIAVAFAAALVIMNAYPFALESSTLPLVVLHLPVALWLAIGIAYAGGRWNEVARRMDFIRFSGELVIYLVLLALGGALLVGFTALIFQAIGIDMEPVIEQWLGPCGMAGGVIVASWLVEAKQSVIENMAPVLTRLFTPFFTAALIGFLVTLLVAGRGIDVQREALIAFDSLLVVVLALFLYSISARDPQAPPGLFDTVQVVLVVSALIANAFALWAIAARIGEMGFTPNRMAALGMNVILILNLGWSAVLYGLFLRGRGGFAALERWQTAYLPVYAAWAAFVVVAFPPLFGFR